MVILTRSILIALRKIFIQENEGKRKSSKILLFIVFLLLILLKIQRSDKKVLISDKNHYAVAPTENSSVCVFTFLFSFERT